MPRDAQDLSSSAIKPITLAVEVLSTDHWTTREVPDCCPLKENAMGRDTFMNTGTRHGCQDWSYAATSQGTITRREAWNRPFPGGSSSKGPILQRNHGPVDSLIVFGLRTMRIKFCCLKPPSLWHFVMAALGNSCRYVLTQILYILMVYRWQNGSRYEYIISLNLHNNKLYAISVSVFFFTALGLHWGTWASLVVLPGPILRRLSS